MTSRFEIDRQTEAREARIAAQTEALKNWLAENHPEIRFGVALLREFTDYMQDSFLVAGTGDFAYALSQIDTRYIRQHIPTPAEQKSELIEEICDLLRAPDPSGKGGRYSAFNINTVRSQMQSWSLEKLTERRDEIVRAQELSKKPVAELKAIVRENTPQHPQWPALPEQMWDSTLGRHVTIDAQYLNDLTRTAEGMWTFKRLAKLYGPHVDERRGIKK